VVDDAAASEGGLGNWRLHPFCAAALGLDRCAAARLPPSRERAADRCVDARALLEAAAVEAKAREDAKSSGGGGGGGGCLDNSNEGRGGNVSAGSRGSGGSEDEWLVVRSEKWDHSCLLYVRLMFLAILSMSFPLIILILVPLFQPCAMNFRPHQCLPCLKLRRLYSSQ
jgi:hypothetical protein